MKQDDTIPPEILKEIEEEERMIQEQKQEKQLQIAEKEEEEEKEIDIFENVEFPTIGEFKHIKIDKEPCIDKVFPNTSPKEFYAKLLFSPSFWEHVFVVTDSTDIKIPKLENNNNDSTCLSRICTFIAPIKGAPMGPKQTRVRQTHRVSMPNEE